MRCIIKQMTEAWRAGAAMYTSIQVRPHHFPSWPEDGLEGVAKEMGYQAMRGSLSNQNPFLSLLDKKDCLLGR